MIAALNNRNFQAGFFILIFLAFAVLTALTGEIMLLNFPILLTLVFLGWQRLESTFYILLLSLPFSVEYAFSDSLGIDFPDEPLMIFLGLAGVAYLVFRPHLFSRDVLPHPIMWGLFALLAWTITTTAFSSEPLVSVKYLLAKGWYMLAFVLVPLIFFQTPAAIKNGIRFLLISMTCVVLIVVVRHAFLSFRFTTINEAVSPFFRNHVNYSAMLSCMIPVLFAGLILGKQKTRKYWSTGLIFFLGALYLGYSRGAWLALGVGVIAYWLIIKRLLLVSFILSIFIFLGAVFWLKAGDRYLRFAPEFNKTIFHPDFSQHIRATYQLKDISTAERFYRWVAGVRMIKENPLTGFGPNSFYYHYQEYALPAFKTWVSTNPERSTVHNYFLLMAIEQGIPGLIIFLILAGMALYYAEHLYHRTRDRFFKIVSITTGVIFTMIMTLNLLSDLIETDKVGSLFFLCLAILVISDIKTRNELNPSSDI